MPSYASVQANAAKAILLMCWQISTDDCIAEHHMASKMIYKNK